MKAPRFWYQNKSWQAALLTPLSWLYQTISTLHRTLRSRNVYRAPVPVISIGNLTMGGSGKTPLTALIATHFATTHTVAIITREPDEAAQLQRQCPQAAIFSGSNKRTATQTAVSQGATLILLDDAFHRLDIARDVDILTFGPHALGNGHLLPAGPLREPISHATRATCYVLQGCPLPANLPPKPTFHLTRSLKAKTLTSLKNKPLVAIAAITHPQAFFSQLKAAGLTLAATVPLPDHAPFTPALLAHLQTLTTHHNATLVCTEKDSPKLPLPHTAIPLTLSGETTQLLKHLESTLSYLKP